MSTRRSFAWMLGAWLTPPMLAGVLGWHGIWGSGSAFADFLIPVPVAGGALHVPSFVAALLMVHLYPRLSATPAARVRAACLGLAIVGVALLMNLQRIFLGATTDLSLQRLPWQANPLGLFLASDALWALAAMLRKPPPATAVGSSLAIALLLPVMFVTGALSNDHQLRDDFVVGQSWPQAQRGDEIRWVYTRLPVSDPAFRDAAAAFVDPLRPQHDVNSEDVAIYFTDSLDTARSVGRATALATLCRYEDGTPDHWHNGQYDCFTAHVSFSDRVAALAAAVPRDRPGDVARYVVARAACTDIPVAPAASDGVAAQDFCRHTDLPALHEALQETYGDDVLTTWLAEPRVVP